MRKIQFDATEITGNMVWSDCNGNTDIKGYMSIDLGGLWWIAGVKGLDAVFSFGQSEWALCENSAPKDGMACQGHITTALWESKMLALSDTTDGQVLDEDLRTSNAHIELYCWGITPNDLQTCTGRITGLDDESTAGSGFTLNKKDHDTWNWASQPSKLKPVRRIVSCGGLKVEPTWSEFLSKNGKLFANEADNECLKDTGGSCWLFPCDWRRFSTCESPTCFCTGDACAKDGACIEPGGVKCGHDTGGICHVWDCHPSRNATCSKDKKCLCGKGTCNINGRCEKSTLGHSI